jgi:hypothetical protein
MGKFVLVYTGGAMAETPAAQEEAMKAWGDWFGTLGAAVVDAGAPFGSSTAVGDGGATSASKTGATGYSVVEADNLDLAAKLASGCPIIAGGGTVEVFETIAM